MRAPARRGPADTSGQGFGVDEPFGTDPAGVVFRTRTGTPPGDGLVYLPIADVTDENDAELFGAEVGLLGSELAHARRRAGRHRQRRRERPEHAGAAVPPYRRAAVAALMTAAGRVPGGQVDRDLLTEDATAPFGVRLDPDAVDGALRRGFTDRSVVLVEGSDLVRADLASDFASPEQGERMMRARAARHRSSGRAAARRRRPRARRGDRRRTGAARRRPRAHDRVGARCRGRPRALAVDDHEAGRLREHRRRRADDPPPVRHRPPDAMEGRRDGARRSRRRSTRGARSLADDNADGLFRDGQVGIAMTVVVDRRRRARARDRVRAIGGGRASRGCSRSARSVLVGLLDATYLAGPFHFGRHGGAAGYWLFVVVDDACCSRGVVLVRRGAGSDVRSTASSSRSAASSCSTSSTW